MTTKLVSALAVSQVPHHLHLPKFSSFARPLHLQGVAHTFSAVKRLPVFSPASPLTARVSTTATYDGGTAHRFAQRCFSAKTATAPSYSPAYSPGRSKPVFQFPSESKLLHYLELADIGVNPNVNRRMAQNFANQIKKGAPAIRSTVLQTLSAVNGHQEYYWSSHHLSHLVNAFTLSLTNNREWHTPLS